MYMKRNKIVFEASDLVDIAPDGKFIYQLNHEDGVEIKTANKPIHTLIHKNKMKRISKKFGLVNGKI